MLAFLQKRPPTVGRTLTISPPHFAVDLDRRRLVCDERFSPAGLIALRAADTDRIQVAQLLTDAAAQGRLELGEYEDRLAKAYAARTYDELDRLSADLPGIANTGAAHASPRPRRCCWRS